MSQGEKEFKKRLLAAFDIEADEHIKIIASDLVMLDQTSDDGERKGALERIFRETHSLKGAARAVDKNDIEEVCKSLENLFSVWKKKKQYPKTEHFSILYQSVDAIGERLSSPETTQHVLVPLLEDLKKLIMEEEGVEPPDSDETSESICPEIVDKGAGNTEKKIEKESLPSEIKLSDTVRISLSRLNQIILKTEEMVFSKSALAEHEENLRQVINSLEQWHKEWAKLGLQTPTGRMPTDKIVDEAKTFSTVSLLSFMKWNQLFIKEIEGKLTKLKTAVEENHRFLSQAVDSQLDDMKKVLMLPFSSLMELFPKMVRDLARDQKKDVLLMIDGGEIEIDRRILEEMKDPLIHLIRNAVDHGIELPEERERLGKNRQGKIEVTISQLNANLIELTVSDDGRGINTEKLESIAIKQGVISQNRERELSSDEIHALVFRSGVSTSPIITDISGRGLGLSIVQEKTHKLDGNLALTSEPGKGMSLRMQLPVRISLFRGVLLQTAGRYFLIPTVNVERVLQIKPGEIKTVESRETILVDDQTVPVVSLNQVLELSRKQEKNENLTQIVVLRYGNDRIAVSVKQVISEREGLVKNLGKQLPRVKMIAGVVVFDEGKIVPVLNVPDLMQHTRKIGKDLITMVKTETEKAGHKNSLLVVDDSVTARILLKNILESAGYEVNTAVDGLDAITSLKERPYDLVVADVEMPRMNGFDLTRNIREDETLSDLPVILVTALESKEDREHGMEAGANAYIMKSSFDQNNLLDVIRHMI
ncbi:response regulator [bacterium]|nr:response regulator [bacterium]